MNHLVEIILLTLSIVLALPAIYLFVLTVFGLIRAKGESEDDPIHSAKIAVLVPAHNEGKMIAVTIAALHQSEYPDAQLTVYVIADNCTDATARIAQAAGARVLERTDRENPGKGQALDWALREAREELSHVDIISVIDADTIVHPQFFAEIDRAFSRGDVQAAQGYYGTSNISSGWRAALSEVAFAVSHHLRPLGRNALGSTAGLKGNGMAFSSELLLETGWPAHSLVEDLEFSLLLLERGICVQYCPDAIIGAEMVTSSAAATSQRMRWEGGRHQVVKLFAPRLIKLLFKHRNWAAFESLCDLLFPPLALYVLPASALTVTALLCGAYLPAAIFAAGLAIIPLHIVAALLHRGCSADVWKSLFAVPGFLLWKIPVYLRLLLFGTGNRWVRTKRENEADEIPGPFQKMIQGSAALDAQNIHSLRARTQRKEQSWQRHLKCARVMKRMLDVAGSLGAIICLGPVLLATAVLIWLEDRGPIFFYQQRVGKDGKPFTMIKFRSMRVDAEKVRAELEEENEHEVAVTFKIKKDPRITKVGRWIRKFSIDEMPQFFNVLRGDMSMVGPRPALYKEVALYEGFQLRRVDVKPGISCLWQVQGRSDIDFEGQVRLDLEYIHSESIWKDIVILFKTVPAVILARGAY